MSGRRLLVLGAGISGAAAARLAARSGDTAVVYDDASAPLTPLGEEGFTVHSRPWDRAHLGGVDLVVVSPGIRESSPLVQDALAAGLPVWSELEYAWRRLDGPVVAVTGTNGKTTVTSLITDMAARAGLAAAAAGNIGTALSDVADGRWDLFVVEASSFQLRFIDGFRPDVAVVLNVAPDHLDWHGSFAAYAAAKGRIVEFQGSDDVVVYDADDQGASAIALAAPSRAHPVSGRRRLQGGGIEGGKLWSGDRAIAPVESLDPAWGVDLAAAAVAAGAAGVGDAAVAAAVAAFAPGPHRRTVVASVSGVTYVNDSKATNPHAALASIGAYRRVVLIAGGRNKGLDLAPLVAADRVRAVVAMGESAPELVAVDPAKVQVASTMAEAVAVARAIARPGDTVLLAPGCASFDMYESYAARGDAFARAVHEEVG